MHENLRNCEPSKYAWLIDKSRVDCAHRETVVSTIKDFDSHMKNFTLIDVPGK